MDEKIDVNKSTEAFEDEHEMSVDGRPEEPIVETHHRIISRKRTPGIKNNQISEHDRELIIEKTLEGYSVSAISSFFGRNYQTVNSIVKKYLKTGEILSSKRGGDMRSKLSLEIKEQLIAYVDEECTSTLAQVCDWVLRKFNIVVSVSTIDRTLHQFHYTLKRVTLVPERRNNETTIENRETYASSYRNLEAENDDHNIVFLDEVGFKVVSRPNKGRSRSGKSAFVTVPAARSRNISVVAAMNKYGMIYHKIQERAVNGEDFKECLRNLKTACIAKEINMPIFIMDNARIHHYRGLKEDPEISMYTIKYLPPYSPFLNPIENVFSVWKNKVIRGGALNEPQLREFITLKFEEITPEHCGSFYRKMLGYLVRCSNKEHIFE